MWFVSSDLQAQEVLGQPSALLHLLRGQVIVQPDLLFPHMSRALEGAVLVSHSLQLH